MPVLFIYRDRLLMSLKLHRFWTFCEWICFLFTSFSFSFSISSWSWNFTDSENSQVRMKMLVGYMHCRSGRELVLCGWNFPCTHFVSPISCWANFYEFTGQHLVAEIFLPLKLFSALHPTQENDLDILGLVCN